MDTRLTNAASTLDAALAVGQSSYAALNAALRVLEKENLILGELTPAGIIKPAMKMSMSLEATASSWDPEAPYTVGHNGKLPLGCAAQVSRAKKGANLGELEAQESQTTVPSHFGGVPVSSCGISCQCRIAENGLIDPSLCNSTHGLAAIPQVTRWTYEVTDRIVGGCYLYGWSGWAHPAVMKLLGRFPRVDEVLRLHERSHPKTRHDSERVRVVSRGVTADGVALYHFEHLVGADKKGDDSVPFKRALKSLPPTARIGATGAEESKSTIPLPTAVKSTSPIQALGGVVGVPTFLPALRRAPGLDRAWSRELFPTQVISGRNEWTLNAQSTEIFSTRRSNFVYHHPEELAVPLIGNLFHQDLKSRWAYTARGANRNTDLIDCQYTRSFRPVPPNRVVVPDYAPIDDYLHGSSAPEVLAAADKVLALSRAMGSRANRLQQGFEAEASARWLQVRNFARFGAANRSYYELAYRLVSRYIGARIVEDMDSRIPECSLATINPRTQVRIFYINAQTPLPAPGAPGAPPAPVQNGEYNLWLHTSQTDLATGRAQFLDVEGMSREEIVQALAAVLPQDADQTPHVTRTTPGDPLPNVEVYTLHVLRNKFPNGVTKVFLHFGNQPLPTQPDQQWIQRHAFDPPVASTISTVIRHFVSRHDISNEFDEAFQTAIYRSVGYVAGDARGTLAARITQEVIDCNGGKELHLPRNNTMWGYFDMFYQPVRASKETELLLIAPPSELSHIGSLLCHFRATALNWSSKVISLLGEEWAFQRAGGNQFVRNHLDKWERHYYDSSTNLWSTLFANTMGTQYGFSPTQFCRATEGGKVISWWADHQAPYLVNHYLELWAMQCIPTFQVLPYYDPEARTSHVVWPGDTPKPVQNWPHFNEARSARLAREFSPFPGFGWLGDGGADYNAQFYVAQGNNGQWAKDGGVIKGQTVFWSGEYIHTLPVAPVTGTITTMEDINNPFADFLAPGSMRSYVTSTNRIRNWGIREDPQTPLTERESHRWWEATQGLPHRSLMVNYISPTTERREIDVMADYSVALWENDNRFAGITFSNLFSEVSKPDARFDELRPSQSMFDLSFDSRPTTFSQHQPTRVTAGLPSVPSDAVRIASKNVSSDRPPSESFSPAPAWLKQRVQAIHSPVRNHPHTAGELDYQPKYPAFKDQLPDLSEGQVDIEDQGMTFREERPDPAVLAKLAMLDNYAEELDLSMKKYLEEQRHAILANSPLVPRTAAKWPTLGDKREKRNEVRSRRSFEKPVSARSGESRKVNFQSGGKSRTRSAPDLAEKNPVIPNDSAASESQGQAIRMSEYIDNPSRQVLPAAVIAGSRRRRSVSPRRKEDASATTDGPKNPLLFSGVKRSDWAADVSDSESELEYPGPPANLGGQDFSSYLNKNNILPPNIGENASGPEITGTSADFIAKSLQGSAEQVLSKPKN